MDEPGARRVGFYAADPRGVMPIEGFRVPRSVARAVRRRRYEIRVDGDFGAVARACGARTEGMWLSPRLIAAYEALHAAGAAHSVECWAGGRLVGGLFGVSLGGLFTGESMFHHAPDAGNVALVATARRLAERRYVLWDVQMVSAHTARFGAEEVPAREYTRRLAEALAVECRFS
jgi:leucyl/phenylalanyl-tRNA--protein transferase